MVDNTRLDRYAEAIRDRIKLLTPPPLAIGTGGALSLGATEFDIARAVTAVADEELAEARAEGVRELQAAVSAARRAEAAEAKLRNVEALAERWVRRGVMRSMEATVTARCGDDLRAVLARSQAPQAPAEQEGEAHTRTEYGTLNCPVQRVRTYEDGGECSGCGAVIPAAPSPRPATADDEGVR